MQARMWYARPAVFARVAMVAAVALFVGAVTVGCTAEEAAPVGEVAPVVGEQDAGAVTGQDAGSEPGAEAASPEATTSEADAAGASESDAPTGVAVFMVMPDQSQASYLASEEFFSGAVERLGKALGLVEPVGVASGVQGSIDLVLDGAPQVSGGELVVDLRGLTSDDERRDRRIREEWLESNLFPEATFVITGAEGLPEAYSDGEEIAFTLLGDLTVRGVTLPVAWDTVATITGDTLKGSATARINMSEFGVQPPNMANMFKVEDALVITADLVATSNPTEE